MRRVRRLGLWAPTGLERGPDDGYLFDPGWRQPAKKAGLCLSRSAEVGGRVTRFFLIRHAAVDLPGNIIAGRLPDIHLSSPGYEQARRLGGILASENIVAVLSSPRDRARETAQCLAEDHKLTVQVSGELDELDYGAWTGAGMESLERLDRWRAFNSNRTCARIPGGELIVETQARVVTLMNRLREQRLQGAVALITHAAVIRAALAYYLAFPLDCMLRLEISPASISIVELHNHGPMIACVNFTEDLPR